MKTRDGSDPSVRAVDICGAVLGGVPERNSVAGFGTRLPLAIRGSCSVLRRGRMGTAAHVGRGNRAIAPQDEVVEVRNGLTKVIKASG